jgi:hypothetical protein
MRSMPTKGSSARSSTALARPAEHHGVARGLATKGVRGGIIAIIGFGLDDHAADAVEQKRYANEIARDQEDVAPIE